MAIPTQTLMNSVSVTGVTGVQQASRQTKDVCVCCLWCVCVWYVCVFLLSYYPHIGECIISAVLTQSEKPNLDFSVINL